MIPIGRGAGAGPRKVLVSEELAAAWMTRTADGWRLSVEWGEPDADGFYNPTFTQTDDGWLTGLLQAARAEVIAEIRAWAESNAVRADAMYSRAAVVGLAALRDALLPPTEPK